jgi:hypothetical protein
MGIHEPCQVRKEAALSGHSHVPRERLGRANCLSNAYGCVSTEGARHLNNHKRSSSLFSEVSFLFLLCNIQNRYGIIERLSQERLY